MGIDEKGLAICEPLQHVHLIQPVELGMAKVYDLFRYGRSADHPAAGLSQYAADFAVTESTPP
jgi:hypothetical protein